MKIEEMILKKSSDCTGCAACANICPKNCIEMVRDSEGFEYPKINHEKCIECGKCEKICPSLNFSEKDFPDIFPKVFAAIHTDEKIRLHSSSGGVFTAISEIILNDGGIVFGAGFDKNWSVFHTQAENFDELENLRGSKYVQSQIGDIFKKIKYFLENGRKVLFSGTSCQCAGLKNFLGKDFENLFTLDLICHGTPSPEIWEKYISWRGEGHEISRVHFRHKPGGTVFKITFKDCGYYAMPQTQDIYNANFLVNLFLRPSCYNCKFRFPNLFSDITCSDAWGIENFAPELQDNRGISLAIIHTEKGMEFFKKARLRTRQLDMQILFLFNPSFFVPAAEDFRRKNFFEEFAEIKNPMPIMQKYLMKDADKAWADNSRQTAEKIGEFAKKILAHYSRRREHNIFVVTEYWQDEFKKFIQNNLFPNVKDLGIILAKIQKFGEENYLQCADIQYGNLSFQIPTAENSLKDFCDDFGIKNILIIQMPNFDWKIIGESLQKCDRNIQILEPNF